MKKIFNNYHISGVVLATLIYIILAILGIITTTKIDYSFFMTAAIAIEGFLFTSLSIILATSDKKFMTHLRKAKRLRKLEILILSGMLFSGAAILAYTAKNLLNTNNIFLCHFITLCVVLGVISFIISSIKLFSLLKLSEDFDQNEYN